MLKDNKRSTEADPEPLDAAARMLKVITDMTEKDLSAMPESYQRLVACAAKLRGIHGGTALTRALHYTDPQLVNNWQRRGVSRDGALDRERYIGVPAVYILYGTVPSTEEWNRLKKTCLVAEEPAPVYQSNELRELTEIAGTMDKSSLRSLLLLLRKMQPPPT